MTDLERTPEQRWSGHDELEPRRTRVAMSGCRVDLMDLGAAIAAIAAPRASGDAALAVASVNLDHLHHFGTGARWEGVIEQSEAAGGPAWLSLVDGAPLVARAEQITGRPWPRLAGSDLADPVLDAAAAHGLSVGFLGGSSATHERLRAVLAESRPTLRLSGTWAPSRAVVSDPVASRALAAEIRASRTDLLVVGLGKPRQELWIAEHGHLTGAHRLLAFGAVVDFLAGEVSRAPRWMADHGLEWSYRLAREPRRLARRYLVDGPVALARLRSPDTAGRPAPAPVLAAPSFTPEGRPADVTVVVITHQSARQVDPLLADLRREVGPLRLRVVVVDNRSTDATVERVSRHADVVLDEGANDGYAAGVNRGVAHAGDSRAVLVLNPDVRLEDGALLALWKRLWRPGVGVAVPALLGDDGRLARSLRFEPSLLRCLGDALLGDRCPTRPTWATETDHDAESYAHAHAVDWATGAALLVRTEVLEQVGAWDERYFLYSEEVDFQRRVREAGWTTWFEPAARMRHTGGGSGGPDDLGALLAVNRVRYLESVHGRAYAAGGRAAVVVGEALRSGGGRTRRRHRRTLGFLLARSRWDLLPHAESDVPARGVLASPGVRHVRPSLLPVAGAVLVPAHDEEAVIGRALAPLATLALDGLVEVVVAANGCHDATVERALRTPRAVVLDLPEPSKTAALNAADDATSRWPRLYLDADVEITARAVADVLAVLTEPGATGVLAARPPYRYDCSRSSVVVRAYYAARERLPEASAHLWGAGVYGLSRAGHDRFGRFPDVVADDLFVDRVFAPDERAVVLTDPVVVHVPRDLPTLLATLRRSGAGNRALAACADLPRDPSGPATTLPVILRQLLASTGSPRHLAEALVYGAVAVAARLPRSPRGGAPAWARDEGSRAQAGPPDPDRPRPPRRSATTTSAASSAPTPSTPSTDRVALPTTRVI
ncbi:WecB/TagA/CpsF family glycosyltransferase [Nocardioides zeae]|uniref:WecB/TagA/CpsF family glycosyltransferase n=1 Tax=Nocardioides zeae TaxID=1457234 RepID=A0A6P0HFI7_9ACTN|nr:WecB/TagA/CpsF family glycosyltransferase [Nocardioides zeae]NEN77296.1 WecB/TagA/CpsF family glycosyltransferase [Nocardioides zeae]